MKKFRFSLRSVETVRALKEMRAREAFSNALQEHARAQQTLEHVKSDIRALEELLLEERSGALRAPYQGAYIRAHELSLDRQTEAENTCQEKAKLLDARREEWVLARRDLRVIENLESKARQEFRKEYEREEQALLDDRTSAVTGRAPLLMS